VADNQLQFLNQHGKNARVVLKGTFSGKEMQWQATIARSEGVVDNKSRMSYLVAQINDPYALESANKEQLRFGSYVNADIVGVTLAQATTVPRYLVENSRVAVLDDESKLRYVIVDIVRQEGANVIIAGGLNQDDRIIVSALDYPIDGMALALEGSDDAEQQNAENTADTQVASVGE